MDLKITNCRLSPDSEPVEILIKNRIIHSIGKQLGQADEIKDAKGDVVIPGLIDMNCDICDPGYENKEDFESIGEAAFASGFTTITANPNSMPVADNKTVVRYVVSKGREMANINIIPYGCMTKGGLGEEIAEIGEMKYAGIGAISDGGKTVKDANLLRMILIYSKMFNMPVITNCMDESLMNEGVMNEGVVSTKIGLKGIPREAEEVIVARNLVLAEHTGGRLHIANVSTKGSVQLIKDAKARGVNVTCDTCPHYFTLTEEVLETYNTLAKIKPPLKTQEDIDAILEGLRDGTIDVIASGHTPTTIEMKKKEFDMADFGLSALETALPLCYTHLVETGVLSFQQFMEKLSYNPARILGIEKKGKIEKGYIGELAIVDFKRIYQIKGEVFKSKAKFTPYENHQVKGKVKDIIF